ncbi:MFS transporter [Bailinhaonella thermotolerans]|uniref:MFS transporter n=1 Tax=Bailinhaonella thermotolerans TaxID=1070861 RepID=A0A3A4BPY5_9ACTN|nr:MFS transporter [Bailinhaonella thermotolerans]RJL33206.1 MFS transporter [Bailinhaonella thermotolerans]
MARRLYAFAFLDDLVLLYPVYALLFARTGLSAAQISSLFVIWSVTSFALEIPSGLWADLFSRRRLLIAAPLLGGAGFALWTFFPSYPAFAAGFLLWGAGTALRSGALQALVYEELARAGATSSYPRLIGRSEAVATTAEMFAAGLAAPVLAAGGYLAVGVASVVATVLTSLAAAALPESRARPGSRARGESRPRAESQALTGSAAREESSGRSEEGGGEEGFAATVRAGLAGLRGSPTVRRALLLVAALMGVTAIDEYIPLLAESTGAGTAAVPLLMLLVLAGNTAGGWLAGTGTRWAAPVLAVGAVCLAAGALIPHPAGLVLIAAAFGVFQWTTAAADARLQAHLTDRTRATMTSVSGLGAEVFAVLTFAAYALGSTWSAPGPLFALAALPYLMIALILRRNPHHPGDGD